MTVDELLNNPQVKKRLPGLLNVGALLLLTASLAQWTWLLAKPNMTPSMTASSNAAEQDTQLNVQPLLSAHLFGQVSQELGAGRLENLPISSMNLVLSGVIAASSGGFALLSANGQPQESFAVGQAITGGAVLQAVYRDRIVIEHNGVMESLLLEGSDKQDEGIEINIGPEKNQALANVVEQDGPNRYTLNREQLTEQMRTPDFLKQATMVPYHKGGFLVRQLQPGSLYEKMGLQPGDVIQQANGTPINTAEDAMKLYQQITSVNDLQMEILRGGKPVQLFYQLQ